MYKRILVPMDGTESDGIVLAHVRRLAKALGASVKLILLFRVIKSEDPFFKNVQMETGASGYMAKERAETYLPELEASLREEGVEATAEFLIVEEPEADEIVRYAEEKDCDLIAMANPERTGIGRWFFSSIEERVKRRSPLPLLLVSG
jgi:nucleotide-binding universal stress UspA family protein